MSQRLQFLSDWYAIHVVYVPSPYNHALISRYKFVMTEAFATCVAVAQVLA